MPRHKATPKKHDNEPTTSILSSNDSNNDEEKISVDNDDCKDSNDDVLDLSVKRRKITSTRDQRQNSARDHEQNSTRDHKQNSTRDHKQNLDTSFPSQLNQQRESKLNVANCFGLTNNLSSLYSVSNPFFDSLSVGYPTSQPLAPSTSSYKNVLCQSVTQNDSLSKLSNLVSKVGKSQTSPTGASSIQDAVSGAPSNGLNFQELWWRFVKKEENAELKRMNEAKQIFTCLQCQASFQTMDQLVKHMEATQHYANIPKHYSWSLQYARQKMRQMKMKMKYSDKMMYFCFLCQIPFTEPVHVHFNCAHNMHNPAENMKFVQIISVGSESCSKQNRSKTELPSPCGTSTTNGSDCSSPLQHSVTPFSNCSDSGSPEKIKCESVEHRESKKRVADQQSSEFLVKNNKSHNLLSKMEELVQNAMKEQSLATAARKSSVSLKSVHN